jgi:hypothetical protein
MIWLRIVCKSGKSINNFLTKKSRSMTEVWMMQRAKGRNRIKKSSESNLELSAGQRVSSASYVDHV